MAINLDVDVGRIDESAIAAIGNGRGVPDAIVCQIGRIEPEHQPVGTLLNRPAQGRVRGEEVQVAVRVIGVDAKRIRRREAGADREIGQAIRGHEPVQVAEIDLPYLVHVPRGSLVVAATGIGYGRDRDVRIAGGTAAAERGDPDAVRSAVEGQVGVHIARETRARGAAIDPDADAVDYPVCRAGGQRRQGEIVAGEERGGEK